MPGMPNRARVAASGALAALDVLSEAVTITDSERRFRYANRAAARILGYDSPDELIDAPLGQVRDQWISTHADGSPLRPEDVPSHRIVHGEPAEPLLTHIVH